MKLCFIVPRLTYSGAPKMLAWVANQMRQKGHTVEIVAFFSDEVGQPLAEGVSFHHLNICQSKNRIVRNTLGMLQTQWQLHSHIRQTKPDVVISFLDSVGYVYLLLNKLFGRRKIVVSERVDPYQYKGVLSKVRFRLMKLADGFVFQTDGAKNFFAGMLNGQGVVIPNPVTVSYQKTGKPCAYSDRDNRIVTVGRLSLKQKRQDVLLEAFRIVRSKHPQMQLYIYGDGSDAHKIQTLIDGMGLQDAAILAGRTNQVEKDIYNARAFALTSDFEGIPNALIEAMSLGVPSISTDCSPGGAALLVKNGENAFLVDCADAQAIAEKLLILIEDQDISEAFACNGPKIAETFSEDKIASAWETYLTEVCMR